MEIKLLTDPDVFPDSGVLRGALGMRYATFETLGKALAGAGLEMTWKYYNDGKAWLCKVSCKKKTVFWMSVWKGFLKTSFYFTEKTRCGVATLDIDGHIKTEFARIAAVGKLHPLIINVTRKSQVRDVMVIAGYKKALK